ncbi:endolytic transglycosylase MltG [Salinimonas marina]|uniref:Endolytic murein transglycosylase n=1 Tax=Salinimonas marina TaxID=2785918 RepID=A0A7S9HBU6_9ALTE|nr:endolytic transglycosylase MltG [Salinimonas marina]QPG04460.1 endolytic transglycosylase MltG [Salinimonas marina]
MTRFKAMLAVLLTISIVAIGGIYFLFQQRSVPLNLTTPSLITIAKGSSAHRVLKQLEQQSMLPVHPLVGKIWLKVGLLEPRVKAGTYKLQPGMTVSEAFSQFNRAEEAQFSISLIDGLTFSQWQQILSSHPYVEDDLTPEKLNELSKVWAEQTGTAPPSLEGLFLADTYQFTYQTRASQILRRAMLAMSDLLASQWPQRAADIPLKSAYEALILASIIEKETAVPAERAEIAGVFSNRLHQNMRLQTDPTVIYGIGESFDGNLTRAHLREKTAYNTYVIRGLPPTPIAMAGRPAIRAALQPATTEALYFVARGDGSHQFSTTLQQHNAAVRKYQLQNR